LILNGDFITKHWYASVYEQFENQTNDVEFLIGVLKEHTGDTPQKILEAACGGGRVCVPLAEAGHTVTGFDSDEQMLLRCYRRMRGLGNIRCFAADATTADWGTAFDVVLLAGNLLINIESETDYAQAQRTLISKAAAALRKGGHLYLDFDLHGNPAPFFSSLEVSSYFCGTDELGTKGRTVSYGSTYDPVTRICAGTAHWELTTNAGETIVVPRRWHKHIPTQAQVYAWLREAGLAIKRTYLDYSQETVPVPARDNCRATLWARKA
jgi:SAM-dependent methyltransferase